MQTVNKRSQKRKFNFRDRERKLIIDLTIDDESTQSIDESTTTTNLRLATTPPSNVKMKTESALVADQRQVRRRAVDASVLETRHDDPREGPQRQAIEALWQEMIVNQSDRAQLIMTCGTGKTRVTCLFAKRMCLIRRKPPLIVVFVPSRALLSQTVLAWHKHWRCGDDESRQLPTFVQVSSTPRGGRTNAFSNRTANRLQRFVSQRQADATTAAIVVVCTFGSAQSLAGLVIDLAIVDEAHRTVLATDRTRYSVMQTTLFGCQDKDHHTNDETVQELSLIHI